MNSKKQKEEFYSKDETEEFVCENYFLNEPFFMKEALNNPVERENQCENFPQNFNELGINNEKICINISDIKKDSSNCVNQNEAIRYGISDMTSQADTNYQNKFGKNSKPNSQQSQNSNNNNPAPFHNHYNNNRQKTTPNFNNTNFLNNYNLNNLNNQNNQNILELLISNRLIEDPSVEKEKLLNQKKNRPVENTTSTKVSCNNSSSNNNKLLNIIMNSINQNLVNDQIFVGNQGNGMINESGKNIHNMQQNQGAFNFDMNQAQQGNINMQLLESYLNSTKQNSEAGENKILKSLLVNKVNDILINSNLSEKLILYNMITNSHQPNNLNTKPEPSVNIDQGNKNLFNFLNLMNNKTNGSIASTSINNNTNIKQQQQQQNVNFNIPNNQGNSLNNNFNGSFPSKSDIMEKYINNEVIRCTIENFCKFLFSNGYCIVNNNKLNNNLSQNSFFQNLLQTNFNLDNFNKSNSNNNISNEFSNSNNYLDPEDSIRKKTKDIINCPHTDRKHYAKNMCNNCYHKQGRVKKAWLCSHTNRPHYARGKCQNCYLNFYHREQISKKREKKAEIDENKDESNFSMPYDEGSMKNYKHHLNNEIKIHPAPSSDQRETNGENNK